MLLRALARIPVPTCPADLKASVWRAIHLREADSHGMVAALDHLAATLWRAKVVACSMLTSVAVGAIVAFASQTAVPEPTAGALGLRAFSADAPSLPSTLLTR